MWSPNPSGRPGRALRCGRDRVASPAAVPGAQAARGSAEDGCAAARVSANCASQRCSAGSRGSFPTCSAAPQCRTTAPGTGKGSREAEGGLGLTGKSWLGRHFTRNESGGRTPANEEGDVRGAPAAAAAAAARAAQAPRAFRELASPWAQGCRGNRVPADPDGVPESSVALGRSRWRRIQSWRD